jgi:glucose-6-phosphate isomerase
MAKLLNSEKIATEYALIKDQRPCLTVFFDSICPETVGQFLYLYEVTTSLAGMLFRVNPYDQPAVELGKEATFALMGRPGYEEMAEKIRPFAEPDYRYLM